MRAINVAVFTLVAFTLAPFPAAAQDANIVEVTPYVAIGTAGAAPVGAAITFPVAAALSVETDIAYRRGEGHIHALSTSTSLLWFLPRVRRSTPYLAGGVGLSQYGSPVFSSNGPPIGTQLRVAVTGNAGGGVKMPMNGKLDLRTDARWFTSYGTGATTTPQVSFASEGGAGTPTPNLSIEVDDVEVALSRVRAAGCAIEYGPVDESWGVRRFYVRDPFGTLVNILEHKGG